MRHPGLFRKPDIFLLGFWGVFALGLLFIQIFGNRGAGDGSRLVVICENEVYGEYDLKVDRTIIINDGNTCEIRDGKVRMTEADCPDKVCMRFREISRDGDSIVCLPNHVILKIAGDREDGGIDAVSE